MKREQLKELLRLLLPPAIAGAFGVFTASQFAEWIATTMGIATMVPILVEVLKAMWKLEGVVWKLWFVKTKASRILTWGLCIVGIVLSYYVGWGFQNMSLTNLGLNALVAIFFANGYYKYDWVQKALAIMTQNLAKIKELQAKYELKKSLKK